MSSENFSSRRESCAASTPNTVLVHQPRAYSVREFCRLYGIGRTAAYAEIKAKRLQALKAGRRTLISVDAAQAWLSSLPELAPVGRAQLRDRKE